MSSIGSELVCQRATRLEKAHLESESNQERPTVTKAPREVVGIVGNAEQAALSAEFQVHTGEDRVSVAICADAVLHHGF